MKQTVLLLAFLCLHINIRAQQADSMSFKNIEDKFYALYDQGYLEEALVYAQKLLKIAEKEKNDSVYTICLSNVGIILQDLGQLEKAEYYLIEVVKRIEQEQGPEASDFALVINELAAHYKLMGRYEEAEPLYQRSIKIWKIYSQEDPVSYALGLNSLATLYKEMGRYEEAEQMYIQSVSLIDKGNVDYATALNNLALFYEHTDRFEEAKKLFSEVNRIDEETLGKEHPLYAIGLNNMALLSQKMGNFQSAEQLFLAAIKIQGKTLGKENNKYASTIYNLAGLYQQMQQFDKSRQLFSTATSIWEKIYSNKSPLYSMGLNGLAILALEQNQLDSALFYCRKSILANSPTLSMDFSDYKNLDQYEYYSNARIFESAKTLVRILNARYEKTKAVEDLKIAYSAVLAGININRKIRNSFNNEANKLRIADENLFFVTHGIETALKLSPPQYYHEAFRFAEQNKSILLADALKGNRARTLGDLPDSLVLQEIALQEQLDYYKKLQLNAVTPEDAEQIRAQLNTLHLSVEAFQQNLKNKYPKYHALKYEQLTVDAKEVQANLDAKTLFLEYFVSDSALFLFTISQKEIELKKLPLAKTDLALNIKDLRTALTDYEGISRNPDENYQKYTQQAYWFYKTLLAPALLNNKSINQLIIVADAELGHLPFEAFLTEHVSEQRPYTELPYLLHKYKISYNYSAALWKENLAAPKRQNNGQMLAAAASYTNKTEEGTIPANRASHLRNLRDALQELPAAKEEVAGLAKLFKGLFWQEGASNEANFKANVGDYAIIHLAMHGLLNQRAPILSSLAFTENGDSTEDNFLEAWEISHLQLNADLVVLSACETGYGKLQQGEGIMSLARSFMYAGVPSLVVSMWQVNDASTSFIMQAFYKNLAKGKDKAEALRQAKLEYIKMAGGGGGDGRYGRPSVSTITIAAHPAFWAPFVQLGDSRPIRVETRLIPSLHGWWWVGIGLAAIAAIGGGAMALRRRNKER